MSELTLLIYDQFREKEAINLFKEWLMDSLSYTFHRSQTLTMSQVDCFLFCFVANKSDNRCNKKATSGQWCSGWNCCLSATRSWNQTQLCEWSLHVSHRLCVGFHWVLRFPPQLKIFHLQSVSLTTPLTPDLPVVSAQWVSTAPLATFHCPVVWQIKFYLAN